MNWVWAICIIACIVAGIGGFKIGRMTFPLQKLSASASMVLITTYSIAAQRLGLSEPLAKIMDEASTIDPDEISNVVVDMMLSVLNEEDEET